MIYEVCQLLAGEAVRRMLFKICIEVFQSLLGAVAGAVHLTCREIPLEQLNKLVRISFRFPEGRKFVVHVFVSLLPVHIDSECAR